MPPQITKVNQDLFISYSRKDKIFVQRLCGALAGFKQTIWVDFEDILPTEEWLRKIFYGIEAANNFIFIISPDSINSNVCSREITYALENHKRLIPLLHREIDSTAIPDPLASRNWIFFRETDDFDASLQTLIKAINTDPEWVNRHTRLQVRAHEWEENKQSASLVLTSGELREAETWLNQASQHGEPQPTLLQIDYIHSSRKIARLRQRILYTTISIIIGITSVLGWYGWQQRNNAAKEAQGVLARKLASEARLAIDQEDASPIGILLAIESMRLARSPDTNQAIRQNLIMRWHPLREISTGQDVQAMAFSPDGKYLATAHAGSSENNSARIWDTTTGSLITSLMHTSGVYSVAFSQDGKLIAVGGEDGITKVWGVSEGKEIANFKQPHSINSVEFSVDNKYLTTRSAFISGNTKNNVQIWDLSDKKASPRIQPKAKGDHTFDGKLTMEHEPNNAPVLLETESGLELGRLPYSRGVYAADLSGDGHYIATGSWDTTARIWAVNDLWEGLNFEEVARLPHSGRLYSVALSPDGKYLATYDSVIRIRAVGSAKEVARLFHDGHGPIDLADLSPDGKFIATGGQNNDIVEIWDQSNNQVVYILKLQGSTTALAFSPDSKYLATGDSSGTIQVWNTNNWQEVSQLHQRQYILSIAYNLDGALLFAYSATYGDSAPTKVWNIEKREEVARIASYGALTTSPDGAHIAGSCEEPNACIWKVGEFTEVHRLPHENGVTSTAYSPDGKYLATGSWDQKARIWDTKSGREMLQLVHNSGINSVAFNDDGRFLATATGNGDNTARVWDIATKKKLLKSYIQVMYYLYASALTENT